MRKKRLLWLFLFSHIILPCAAIMTVALVAYSNTKSIYFDRIKNDLFTKCLLVADDFAGLAGRADYTDVDRACKTAGRAVDTRITVILPSGRVVGDTLFTPEQMDLHKDRPEVKQAVEQGRGHEIRYSFTAKTHMIYAAMPLYNEDEFVGVIRASVPLDAALSRLAALKNGLLGAGLIFTVAFIVTGLLVNQKITTSIDQFRERAERYADGSEQVSRTPVTNYRELDRLGDALNRVAEQMEERIRALRRQRNELEAVLASMVEGVIAVDTEQNIININRAAGEMTGVEPSRARGRSIQETIRNPDIQKFVTEVLSKSTLLEKDIQIHRDGELHFMQAHGMLLYDGIGRSLGALVVLNDVTHLRRLENMRKDFVANVSHELKTPITSIKGSVETLQDGAIENPGDASRFLAIIGKHAERMNAIVNDLLILSRLDQEDESSFIEQEPIHVCDILSSAVMDCEVKASEKQIGIEIDCDDSIKLNVNRRLLEQAVVNLIDNAIKYSDPGRRVYLSAVVEEGEARIIVRDNGMGIPKENQSRIFERFYRVDKARSRKLGGTGLGLAIVKHIAKVHGGQATVESAPGKGSSFTIHLPGKTIL